MFTATYLFAGAAALIATVALGAVLAIPELTVYGGDVTACVVALASTGGLAAGAMVWLSGRCGRRQRFGRNGVAIGCGVASVMAVGMMVLHPGDAAPWFARLCAWAAAGVVVLAVGTAVLLWLPASAAYLRGDPGDVEGSGASAGVPAPLGAPAHAGGVSAALGVPAPAPHAATAVGSQFAAPAGQSQSPEAGGNDFDPFR